MLCPITGLKMFWACPNFLCQTKNHIYILSQSQTFCARQKDDLHSVNWFLCVTKGFEEALNALKFLGWLKKFGPAQNILGPVKGQGINDISFKISTGLLSMKGKDKNETIYFQMII